MSSNLLNIKEASEYLNVSKETLRIWDRINKLKPLKTNGGHRRYKKSDLDLFIGISDLKEDTNIQIKCCVYSRVSSNEQKIKGDLERQSNRLINYCVNNNLFISDIIKDVGSGLNDNRIGFNKLTKLITEGKINKLVIENKDRLTRFQFNFIEKMFKHYGCDIIVVDKKDVSDNEELVVDMLAILASFSGKYYGNRSAERRKKQC
jgi:putative resolvase